MSTFVKISSSKSLVNRYLVLKEGFESFELDWSSEAKDVLHLKEALRLAPEQKSYEIGQGGTTLRFFTTYLSTFEGSWRLNCKSELLMRPQGELIAALDKLGVKLYKENATTLVLQSKGWQTDEITVDATESTQVLSGLLLAAVSRHQPLNLQIGEEGLNSDYFKMTLDFIRQFGFKLNVSDKRISFSPQSFDGHMSLKSIESDWSSAAFLFVLAALKGKLSLGEFEKQSLQPDSVILDLLESVGASVDKEFSSVGKGLLPYKGFEVSLQKSPDLFPVLCVLACFCEGRSKLFGAPQLKNKETNRIEEMANLLNLCGYKNEVFEDGIEVIGSGLEVLNKNEIKFDVSKDHRLYMATEILSAMGYKMKAQGAESILKSFAEYEDLKKGDLACFF